MVVLNNKKKCQKNCEIKKKIGQKKPTKKEKEGLVIYTNCKCSITIFFFVLHYLIFLILYLK